jgi:hypothetical protein
MAGKSDTLEYALLQLLLQGKATNFSYGSTAGTTALWMGLHTADPTDACSTAAEGGYGAYTRIATDRSTGATGWSVTSGTSNALATASPNGTISFPQVATTSTGTFSYASVWSSSNVSSSGCLYFGPLSVNINFSQNVTPQITTGSSITEE